MFSFWEKCETNGKTHKNRFGVIEIVSLLLIDNFSAPQFPECGEGKINKCKSGNDSQGTNLESNHFCPFRLLYSAKMPILFNIIILTTHQNNRNIFSSELIDPFVLISFKVKTNFVFLNWLFPASLFSFFQYSWE